MVKTAVLMATYNGAQFIEKQLDSIRQQSLAPDYVLMRDDCSTDDTVKVVESYIERYALSGWKIIRNSQNLGWRLNFRQLLLDVQDYEVDYVFFSDQDDVWYLDKNERQVTVMEANQNIELLSADIDIEVLSEKATVPEQFAFSKSEKVSQYPSVLAYKTYRPGWTLCLKASFAGEVATVWESGDNISHDNLFSLIAAQMGTAYNLNETVGRHIRYDNNASGNKKYQFTIKSSKSQHVSGLYVFWKFYQAIARIASSRQHAKADELMAVSDFYHHRYQKAEQNRSLANLVFTLSHLTSYDTLSSVARDIIFAFKK